MTRMPNNQSQLTAVLLVVDYTLDGRPCPPMHLICIWVGFTTAVVLCYSAARDCAHASFACKIEYCTSCKSSFEFTSMNARCVSPGLML
mmetsp:Transcript_45292/g.75037  ORF Transcript_45292/g.75037 Transcript_45292/m.75037 type:complete len:89 (+) Transcript_45292:227-493(+)